MKADVYWNLHRKCYSVRVAGRVVAHGRSLVIEDAAFVIQKGGQERARREERKNVHGMIRGRVVSLTGLDGRRAIENIPTMVQAGMPEGMIGSVQISYNPYQNDTFVRHDPRTGETSPITESPLVVGLVAQEGHPVVWARIVPDGECSKTSDSGSTVRDL